MVVYKLFKDPDAKWKETNMIEVINHTEGSGCWKKGTVAKMLKDGLRVQTPTAIYSINKGGQK